MAQRGCYVGRAVEAGKVFLEADIISPVTHELPFTFMDRPQGIGQISVWSILPTRSYSLNWTCPGKNLVNEFHP